MSLILLDTLCRHVVLGRILYSESFLRHLKCLPKHRFTFLNVRLFELEQTFAAGYADKVPHFSHPKSSASRPNVSMRT